MGHGRLPNSSLGQEELKKTLATLVINSNPFIVFLYLNK
jgi:hypothetical protein